jgi:hypothetical protein
LQDRTKDERKEYDPKLEGKTIRLEEAQFGGTEVSKKKL